MTIIKLRLSWNRMLLWQLTLQKSNQSKAGYPINEHMMKTSSSLLNDNWN